MFLKNLSHYSSYKNAKKFSLLIAFTAIAFNSCDKVSNKETSRYSLIVVTCEKLGEQPNDALPVDFLNLSKPIIEDCSDSTKAFLPNAKSKIIGIGWSTSPEAISLFVEKPCTNTQLTSKNCTQEVIEKSINNNLGSLDIASFSYPQDQSDSIKGNEILEFVKSQSESSNPKVYFLTKSELDIPIFKYGDHSKHFYTSVDSIRSSIKNDICNNNSDFIIIYHPPIKKIKKDADFQLDNESQAKETKKGNHMPKVSGVTKDRPKDQQGKITIPAKFERIPQTDKVTWNPELTKSAESITIVITLERSGEVINTVDVTGRDNYEIFDPRVRLNYANVELKPTFPKTVKFSGKPILISHQIFNCMQK